MIVSLYLRKTCDVSLKNLIIKSHNLRWVLNQLKEDFFVTVAAE